MTRPSREEFIQIVSERLAEANGDKPAPHLVKFATTLHDALASKAYIQLNLRVQPDGCLTETAELTISTDDTYLPSNSIPSGD